MLFRSPNRLLYAAREWDTETQLYYNRARYYDAAVGRFVSEDPIGLAGGINPYVYADNDPLDERDPSGLGWECEWEVWGDVTRDVGTGRVVSIANIRFRLAGCWSDGEWGGGGGESGSSSQASAQGRRLGRQGPSCPNSMAWPVSEPHRVTSGWGFRPSPFGLAGVSEGHWSIDIAAATGAPVRASTPGTVTRAGLSQGYGNVVVIRDPSGFTTQYGHLTPTVQEGANVQQGQVIGNIALIGRSTGPHLDFALRYPSGMSKDPRKCLP